MKKNLLTICATAILATTMLTACGSKTEEVPQDQGTSTETTTDTTGDTATTSEAKELFVYGIDGDPSNNINPMTASGRYDLSACKAMFSPLISYISDEEIEYYLATDFTVSEDGLTYTFNLRDDVVWHDGEPFTADDVVFTYETLISNQTANGYDVLNFNGNPLKINKVDDNTVDLVLPYAVPNALEIIASEHFIAPKHIWEGETDLTTNAKNATPIGTGPYKFSGYKEGDNLTLVKNENYFLGEPAIDTVIYKILLDANSALLALQNGEIDALSILPADAEKLDPSQITTYPYTENRVSYMTTFVYRPNMDNIDFRKAIFHAIDKESLNKVLYVSEEYVRNAYSFLPENATYFSEEGVEKYAYNVDTAKELLAKSGVANPTVKIAYDGSNQVAQTQATLVQAYLNEAGFKAEMQAYDISVAYDAIFAQNVDFDLFFGGYIMGIDPSQYSPLFVSDAAYNYSGIKSEVIDKGFADGAVEADPAKREEIYKQLQIDLMNEAFYYPLAENKRILALNNRINIDDAKLVPIYTFEDLSKLTEK